MAICCDCGKRIDFVKTKAGKNMPVNRDYMGIYPLEENSDLIITIVTDEGEVKKGQWAPDGAGIARGRVPHFATCAARNVRHKKAGVRA